MSVYKEDLGAPYPVQFLYRGRLYRFSTRDPYDDKAVQRAMNFALDTAGRKERFIDLGFGVLFADPAAFRSIAARYMLPLCVVFQSAAAEKRAASLVPRQVAREAATG